MCGIDAPGRGTYKAYKRAPTCRESSSKQRPIRHGGVVLFWLQLFGQIFILSCQVAVNKILKGTVLYLLLLSYVSNCHEGLFPGRRWLSSLAPEF